MQSFVLCFRQSWPLKKPVGWQVGNRVCNTSMPWYLPQGGHALSVISNPDDTSNSCNPTKVRVHHCSVAWPSQGYVSQLPLHHKCPVSTTTPRACLFCLVHIPLQDCCLPCCKDLVFNCPAPILTHNGVRYQDTYVQPSPSSPLSAPEADPLPSLSILTAGYSTRDKTSFGWTTARERWPIIIVSLFFPSPNPPDRLLATVPLAGSTNLLFYPPTK